LNSKVLKVKPDIVLRSRKVAIFAHGCYWHQHEGCKIAYSDRPRTEKWEKKFRDNRARDQRVAQQLLEQGWRVAVIWECSTRDLKVFERMIRQLDTWISSGKGQYFESDYQKA